MVQLQREWLKSKTPIFSQSTYDWDSKSISQKSILAIWLKLGFLNRGNDSMSNYPWINSFHYNWYPVPLFCSAKFPLSRVERPVGAISQNHRWRL